MTKTKHIVVSLDTWKRLTKLGKMGETYETALRRLLDIVETTER